MLFLEISLKKTRFSCDGPTEPLCAAAVGCIWTLEDGEIGCTEAQGVTHSVLM